MDNLIEIKLKGNISVFIKPYLTYEQTLSLTELMAQSGGDGIKGLRKAYDYLVQKVKLTDGVDSLNPIQSVMELPGEDIIPLEEKVTEIITRNLKREKKDSEYNIGQLSKAFLTGNASYIPTDIRLAHVCYSLKITYTELMKQPSWFINDYLLILEAKNRVESQAMKRQQSQLQQKRHGKLR